MAGIVNQPTGPPVQEHDDRRLELVWFESQDTKCARHGRKMSIPKPTWLARLNNQAIQQFKLLERGRRERYDGSTKRTR